MGDGRRPPAELQEGGTVRAVVIEKPGDPNVLSVREVDEPVPSGAEVLVRVAAAGVDRADLLQRRGLYPPPAGVDPRVPGLEYAGTVERSGPQAQLRRPGDRVMGLTGGAAYAEYVLVHERETIRVPDRLDLVQAAGVPEVFLTAYDGLFLQGGLQAGGWCLIRPATAGVGIAACQMARALGARSIGTSRSAQRLERVRSWGLDAALVEGQQPVADAVKQATAGRGAAVVLDMLGGGALDENLQSLASGGTLVVIGLLAGARDALELGRLMTRRLKVAGSVMRSRPLEEKITLARLFEERIVPLFEARALSPFVDAVLPLEQAAEAHRRMEGNEHLGKIVLEVAAG
jgi:putative PIG3 family NAD(P)H quinone oxidoreductase